MDSYSNGGLMLTGKERWDDVSWMDMTMKTTVKVTKRKSGPFEYAVSMFKWPAGPVYIGNTNNYLIYLLDPFPRGL